MPRAVSRRRCPRRKSWARMETAWRTVPHLLLQAQRAKASPTPGDPSLRYSYIALIAMAIRDSNSGRLTLAENQRLPHEKVPVFRGTYTG